MKWADLMDMFKNASKNVCTPVIVLSPDPLCPTPSSSSAMKTPYNTEGDPDDSELIDEEDIHVKYSSEFQAQEQ
jgi:hypothetical protein